MWQPLFIPFAWAEEPQEADRVTYSFCCIYRSSHIDDPDIYQMYEAQIKMAKAVCDRDCFSSDI